MAGRKDGRHVFHHQHSVLWNVGGMIWGRMKETRSTSDTFPLDPAAVYKSSITHSFQLKVPLISKFPIRKEYIQLPMRRGSDLAANFPSMAAKWNQIWPEIWGFWSLEHLSAGRITSLGSRTSFFPTAYMGD